MEWNLESFDSSLGNCVSTCQLQDWIMLTCNLDNLVKMSQISLRSIVLDRPCLDKIYSLFRLINDNLGNKRDDCYYGILGNLFRLLRNCCAGCTDNVDLFERHDDLLLLCREWLSTNCDFKLQACNDIPKKLDAIKCLLQFYSNACAGLPSEKKPIRRFIFQSIDCTNYPCKLLTHPDDKVVTLTSAVIYHCLLDKGVLNDFIHFDSAVANLINVILSRCRDDLSEWSLFIVELFLGQNINLKLVIDRSTDYLNLLYDVILSMVKEDNDNRCAIRIKEKNIETLLDLLKEKLELLSKETLDRKWASDEIETVAKLIGIACEISCNEIDQPSSLDDEDLFKNTIGALKSIHLLYKAKALRDHETNDNCQPNGNNLATLKKDLVRLVSNLTYNRPNLQIIASKIDAVPLILDLHSFDVNNPFIREWATCATRNLLYNCQENLEIAHGLKDLSIAADSKLMDKLNLNLIDGKLVPKN